MLSKTLNSDLWTEGSAKFEVMFRTSPPSLLVNSTTDASVN